MNMIFETLKNITQITPRVESRAELVPQSGMGRPVIRDVRSRLLSPLWVRCATVAVGLLTLFCIQSIAGRSTAIFPEAYGSEIVPACEQAVADATSRQISILVGQVQQAMHSRDERLVDSLLARLSARKGDAHPLVRKLKGYWHILQEDYQLAEALLLQVVAVSTDDRDATVNLAVVESRTGRKNQARQRLRALLKIYPDDALIADMLARFK